MKVYEKREKGITLIALVITIIVLLILAGIAIAALSGENGILTRASEAKQKTGREEVIEKAKLEILEEQTEKQRDITDEEAKTIIAKYDKDYDENTNFEFKVNNENNEEYLITKEGYNILVNEIWISKAKELVYFKLEGIQYSCPKGSTWEDLKKMPEFADFIWSFRSSAGATLNGKDGGIAEVGQDEYTYVNVSDEVKSIEYYITGNFPDY